MVSDVRQPETPGDPDFEVALGNESGGTLPLTYNDPFTKSIDDLNVSGLNAAMRKSKERLRKSFTGQEGTGTKARHEAKTFDGYGLFDVAKPKYNTPAVHRLLIEDYTHFSAVTAKTANAIGLGFDLIDSHKTIERKDSLDRNDAERLKAFRRRQQRAKSAMFEWLEELNSDDDFLEILSKVYFDYESCGNGYLEIGRTKLGNIGYIGHIPADNMRVRNKRDGFVQLAEPKAVFFRNFGDTKTADPINGDPRPNEIIHFKKYSPVDLYYGVPDIVPAMSAVIGNKYADQFNLEYFQNKAVPRHVVIVKGAKPGEDKQKQILKFFDEDLRGSHHRTLFLSLPSDTDQRKSSIEINPVEVGMQEGSFSEFIKQNINKILMVHRVPPTKVGMVEGVDLAVARDADKTFKEQVIRPAQRVWEKKLNKIIQTKTDAFRFKFNELALSDETQQAAIDVNYHSIGAITANEIRARWGKPGVEGGDDPAPVQQLKTERQKAADTARGRERMTNASDTNGEARAPKGEGRQQE